MSNLPWFRLYHRIIDDEKVRLIAFEDRWHFIAVCCLKADGLLDEPESALKWRKVAVKLGVQLRELDEIKRRLQEVGLVDENMQPTAWDELQYRSDNSTDRVRKYRERTRAKQDVTPRNVSVTAQDTDTDTDTENPPIAPQGGGAGDLFEDLLGIYPVSPNSKRDRAFKAFSRRPASEQHDIIAAARKYRAWFDADCIRRGRSPEEAAGFVPPLDGWIINGTWKSVSGLSEAPKVEPMVKLDRVRDEALWLACEAVMGKKAPTSDSTWSFRQSVVDQARASIHDMGGERVA